MNSRKKTYVSGLLTVVVSIFACLLVEIYAPVEASFVMDDAIAFADI